MRRACSKSSRAERGVAGTRFEDAEVVPSIGVGRVEAQSLSLLGDGLTQIAVFDRPARAWHVPAGHRE